MSCITPKIAKVSCEGKAAVMSQKNQVFSHLRLEIHTYCMFQPHIHKDDWLHCHILTNYLRVTEGFQQNIELKHAWGDDDDQHNHESWQFTHTTFPTMSRCPWLEAKCRGVSSPRFMTLMRAPLMMSMSTTLERPSRHAQWRGLKPWSSLQRNVHIQHRVLKKPVNAYN